MAASKILQCSEENRMIISNRNKDLLRQAKSSDAGTIEKTAQTRENLKNYRLK